MRLDQFFRHQDQCQDLRPFGDYVADYLSPFGLRVHRQVKGEPTRAGQDKKNSQRVVDDELQERRTLAGRTAAFCRSAFLKKFCGENGNDDARPVRDGVAEK